MTKHFIDIDDHGPDWVVSVLEAGEMLRDKRRKGERTEALKNKTLAVLFEKPSLRTRVSFEQAMNELGGRAIVLQQAEVGLGKRESAADVARVLAGMVDAIAARVFEHAKLRELAEHAGIPVINALSDESHPCQALADIMTMRDEFGEDLSNRTLAFVGDGNNVALSLARVCALLGINFVVASPDGHRIDKHTLDQLRSNYPNAEIIETPNAAEAVKNADAVYADTFISMGEEDQKDEKLKAFEGYQLNEALMANAPDHAIVMHCLPAYRGIEITSGVIEGKQSRVFPQAHNRLHAQKGLLAMLLGDGFTIMKS